MKSLLLSLFILASLLFLLSVDNSGYGSFILLLVGVILLNYKGDNFRAQMIHSENTKPTSISFIMGSDENSQIAYYRHATSYFKQFDQEGAHILISHLRSIDQVLEYLKTSAPGYCPWKTINVVVHEHDRLALQIRNGQPSSHPFPTNVIDKNTNLNIYSPGITNESALVKKFSSFLTNEEGDLPQVSGSPYFNDATIHTTMENDTAHCYYVSFPVERVPTHQEVADAFQIKYAPISLPWNELLTFNSDDGEITIYKYQFLVPESWSFLFQLDSGNAHFKWQEDIRKRIGQQIRENTLLKRMIVTEENSWWNATPVECAGPDSPTKATQSLQSGTRIFCVQVPILEIAA